MNSCNMSDHHSRRLLERARKHVGKFKQMERRVNVNIEVNNGKRNNVYEDTDLMNIVFNYKI